MQKQSPRPLLGCTATARVLAFSRFEHFQFFAGAMSARSRHPPRWRRLRDRHRRVFHARGRALRYRRRAQRPGPAAHQRRRRECVRGRQHAQRCARAAPASEPGAGGEGGAGAVRSAGGRGGALDAVVNDGGATIGSPLLVPRVSSFTRSAYRSVLSVCSHEPTSLSSVTTSRCVRRRLHHA